ncbi:MAG: tetratricopeptide repeat protein, partial [Magnetococcales bacterium]|nr:tetratricopeptide repeat protein [Magnetococcales bacterium]
MRVTGRIFTRLSLIAAFLLTCVPPALRAEAGEIGEIQALLEKKQLAAAMSRLTGYLKSNPKDVQARFFRGLILAEEQKLSEAIQAFQELTEEFPDRPEPFNNLAVLYAEQGQLEKARDVLLKAINTRPEYATARENLGDVYAKLASQSYRKALQISKENPATEAKLALIRNIFLTQGPGGMPMAQPSEEFLRRARNEALAKVRSEAVDKLRAEAIAQVRTEVLEQVRTEVRQKLHAEISDQIRKTEMDKIRAEAQALVRGDERERADAESQERSRAEIEAKIRAEKERSALLEQQAKEKSPLSVDKVGLPVANLKKGGAEPGPIPVKEPTGKVVKEEVQEKAIKDEAPTAMKQLTKGPLRTADQTVRLADMTRIDQVFEAVEKESGMPPSARMATSTSTTKEKGHRGQNEISHHTE